MKARRDVTAWVLLPMVALAMLPWMSFSTWVTLTIAGAAMGMMLFLMASGLTLVFGLMDVMNFAHGAFITLGAYLAVSVLGRMAGWGGAEKKKKRTEASDRLHVEEGAVALALRADDSYRVCAPGALGLA